ncbi:MAG: hypothetical protein H0X31_00820 [Nostocaceae cyanobacterium]|nr:hypothetical protein [Nostocaceae cyanobacterium]
MFAISCTMPLKALIPRYQTQLFRLRYRKSSLSIQGKSFQTILLVLTSILAQYLKGQHFKLRVCSVGVKVAKSHFAAMRRL